MEPLEQQIAFAATAAAIQAKSGIFDEDAIKRLSSLDSPDELFLSFTSIELGTIMTWLDARIAVLAKEPDLLMLLRKTIMEGFAMGYDYVKAEGRE